jgi:hypothetical protein
LVGGEAKVGGGERCWDVKAKFPTTIPPAAASTVSPVLLSSMDGSFAKAGVQRKGGIKVIDAGVIDAGAFVGDVTTLLAFVSCVEASSALARTLGVISESSTVTCDFSLRLNEKAPALELFCVPQCLGLGDENVRHEAEQRQAIH